MTREEFIGIAADAILRAHGHDPAGACPGFTRYQAVEDATAALEAVGAWGCREALKGLSERCDYSDLRAWADDALAVPEPRA